MFSMPSLWSLSAKRPATQDAPPELAAHAWFSERWKLVVFCSIGVLLNTWLACNLFLPDAWYGRNDFLSFYTGAKLAGSPHLYDRAGTREIHLRAVGESGEIQFGRLPYYAGMLKPLGLLPYRAAYVVWELLSAAAFAGFIIFWPGARARTRWCVACWSLPAFVAFFNGQEDLLLLLWLTLAARLLGAGKPAAAGMVLTLCASKFHLFTLVPLVILAQRRWRMAAGMAAGGCALLGISFAVAGPDWPLRYYAVLAHPGINTSLAHMPNLHSLLGVSRLGLALQAVATLALAAIVFLAARATGSYELPLALALVAGVLVGFHGYLHDCSLLLPGIMAFSELAAGRLRMLALTLASPVPWFMLQLAWPLPAMTQLLILAFAVAGGLFLVKGEAGRQGLSGPAAPAPQRVGYGA